MISLIGTGLSGMMGTRFQELYADDYDFVNLDLSTGVDITDPKMVDKAFRNSTAEAVIHFAAFTNVSAAHDQLGDKRGICYRVNVVGTENIVKAANKYNKYLIHISTDYVFDGEKGNEYTETDNPNPIEWYGQTKYMAEQLVQEYMDEYTILRLAFPYQSSPSRPDFLARMMEELKDNTLPPQFIDHIITPAFVDDLAQVFNYCINERPTGIYHAVGSSWHTDFDMAKIVKSVFKLSGDVEKGSLDKYLKEINRPYQKEMRVSNKKLQKDFGIKMKTFEDGLEVVKKQMS